MRELVFVSSFSFKTQDPVHLHIQSENFDNDRRSKVPSLGPKTLHIIKNLAHMLPERRSLIRTLLPREPPVIRKRRGF